MVYTLTLNTSLDYVAHVDELEVGKIHKTTMYSIYPGGKGINVSQVLKELGVENTALGFVAGHTGECLEAIMHDKCIHTDFVKLSCGITRVNMKIRSMMGDDTIAETDINGIGPVIRADELEQLKKQLGRLNFGDTVIVSGSVPPSVSVEDYGELLNEVSKSHAMLVVDAVGDYLKEALKYRPFLIKPNKQELLDVFEEQSGAEVEALAGRLCDMGAENVLVSLGADGAFLKTSDGIAMSMKAPNGTAVNTVGAGDSMVAGFVAGYNATGDREYAMKLGICAGSATTFSDGLATGKQVYDLLEKDGEKRV